MLFWLTLIIFIISGAICVFKWVTNKNNSYCFEISDFIMTLSCVILIIEVAFMGSSYFERDATINNFEQTRISLQYQLDMGVYEPLASNENFDNKDKLRLYEKVEKFNVQLGEYKGHRQNFWVGIFYQADVDNIEYVQYPDRESWLDKADGVKKYEFGINVN